MSRHAFLLFGFVLAGICGCSSSDFPVAPVTGKVTCNGNPVSDATITFSPFGEGKTDFGKAANGNINANGEFTLSTYGSNDGAVLGKHRVMVSFNDTKKNPCSEPKQIVLEVKSSGNQFNIELDKSK